MFFFVLFFLFSSFSLFLSRLVYFVLLKKQGLKGSQNVNPLTDIAKPALSKNKKKFLGEPLGGSVMMNFFVTSCRFFIFIHCFCRVFTFLGFLVVSFFYDKCYSFERASFTQAFFTLLFLCATDDSRKSSSRISSMPALSHRNVYKIGVLKICNKTELLLYNRPKEMFLQFYSF